ncbi:RagB/SusD family nutrient uptake outer membrane protein [Prevotella sp. oral taxon 475]|uniref:RagB/SusD family nutrient uptake outer membrane protein n=1 Tax=Prevotella sp. oral taxon 475 TaxID=712471 RepID=UPI001BAB012F|nr:RagB/SusD family nutrient uptake outer membrane protein [Prevotella sp. oral taxon 475]QUB47665.1 RagB/SusD family nutrient uptake outer membrane protein [Prevotella sp. oral taxon 475]
MRSVKSLFTLTAILLTIGPGLFSCLDDQPRDRLSEAQVFDSPASLYLNTVGELYNYIGGEADGNGLQGTYRGVYDYNTFTTDEAIIPIRGADWYDGGFWQRLYRHEWSADDQELYTLWCYLYKVVVLCNDALGRLDKHRSLLTTGQYESYRAEVRAIRAMFYYYLIDLFGNVPLLTAPESKVNRVTNTRRSEVFSFAFDELQTVAPQLAPTPSHHMGNYYGRLTRPVAYFLLAKLALNAEVFSCDNPTTTARKAGRDIYFTVNGVQMNAWQTVIHYCNRIADLGYRLENNYADNFKIHNENSAENIFTIPMDKHLYANQYQYLFRSRNYHHGKALGLGSENGACATLSTVRAFGYGTPQVDHRYALNFYSDTILVDGDTVRLDDGTPLVYQPLEVQCNLSASRYIKTAGARMSKYEIDRKAFFDGKLQDNDIVLYRYADVLLMLAEAKVRNGQNGDAELHLVRARAGMGPRTATLDNILAERLLELMWEGWRRQDLIRFSKFTQAYDLRTPLTGESNGHTTLFPIPNRAIGANKRLQPNSAF